MCQVFLKHLMCPRCCSRHRHILKSEQNAYSLEVMVGIGYMNLPMYNYYEKHGERYMDCENILGDYSAQSEKLDKASWRRGIELVLERKPGVS